MAVLALSAFTVCIPASRKEERAEEHSSFLFKTLLRNCTYHLRLYLARISSRGHTLALANTSSIMLKTSGERGCSCLVDHSEKAFSFSLSTMLTVRSSAQVLYPVKEVPISSYFAESPYREWLLDFKMLFLLLLTWSCDFLLASWWDGYINWFSNVAYLWDKSHLIAYNSVSIAGFDSLVFCWEFCTCVHERYRSVVFFFLQGLCLALVLG